MERTSSIREGAPLAGLVATAVRAGAPLPVAEEARRATAVRFARGGRRSATRTEAYFWGVVRRQALRGGAPAITRALLMTSLAAELTDAGHAPEAVLLEVARVYGTPSGGDAAVSGGGRAA